MSDPFTSLLDLDGTRRPGLRLRLDGEEYVLRAPEELSLGDAFVLGGAFERLRQAAGDPGRFEATARGIAGIVLPEVSVLLDRRQALTLVAFYAGRVADVVERQMTPAGDPVPFSAPARASSRRRGSRRASASG